MQKYSSKYTNTYGNFVIQNIVGEDVQSKYYGIFCVLKNILQRGTPTPPSKYLVEKLGELSDIEKSPLYLISKEEQQWINRIKGNEEDKRENPALKFFDELIPKYLGEYSFIKNLILPETDIDKIVPAIKSNFYDRQVDFYLPQAKLVIEIDGAQHKGKLQKSKDRSRDMYLNKNGIRTVRIDTESIRNLDETFDKKVNEIMDCLLSSDEIQYYKTAYEKEVFSDKETRYIKYESVIRFQMMILSLLQKNVLTLKDKNWKISLVSSQQDAIDLFSIAVNDLFIWIKHLCKINKLHFEQPEIILKKYGSKRKEKRIIVDFDIYKRWTDDFEINKDIIYIRNDYFDNENYFEISATDSIKYDLVLEGDNSDVPSLNFLLQNIFGFNDFRDGQLPIIVNILKKIDTIGILPTGSGKSLCYQFSALLQPCINFVVCPILALMYDQKENLDAFGITRTNFISSDKSGLEKTRILREFMSGKYLLIWISPERFQSQTFRQSLAKINMQKNFAIAVIDEVHCLSEWGHDFRTSYLNLSQTIRNYCPEACMLGLTATASRFVLEDLKKEFEIDSLNIKTTNTVNREELDFHIIKTDARDKYDELLNILNHLNARNGNNIFTTNGDKTKSGLIFTVFKSNSKGCNQVAESLSKDLKTEVGAFSSDLGVEKRSVQHDYKNNKFPLLVATKSFGMGVDKANIRYTIHYGLPWSIEAFYQEAGRAGRDRAKARCYIIYKRENCQKEIIDNIFELNTNILELDSLSSNLKNDLGDILFLWKFHNKGIERDLQVMCWVMKNLHEGDENLIVCNESFEKPEVEKAIYRLGKLGFVRDWTIEEWGKTTAKILVYQNKYKIDSVRETLYENIRKYDPAFSEENENYRKYFDVLNEKNFKPYIRYMKILLMWTYDNIVYQRRQAIKTMMDACENYVDSESLKNFIENYFKFSDKTLILDQISYNPNNYLLWFELLFEYTDDDINQKIPISQKGIETLMPALQRYLESYRFNCGLNYLSGMIKLLAGKFDDPDGRKRLQDAFSSMSSFSEEAIGKIVSDTLIIGKSADTTDREYLGEFMTELFPERAKQIYKELNDSTSLTLLLNEALQRIDWVKEKIEW